MGNLLKLIVKQSDLNSGVYVDFENSSPTEQELPLYDNVKSLMKESTVVMDVLKNYKGATESIRKAIANPSDVEIQTTTWGEVIECVKLLRRIYIFSQELSKYMPDLFMEISGPPEKPFENITLKQSLARLCAEIINFTLMADEIKMGNPTIQNDFSYYRRTSSRKRQTNEESVEGSFEISLEEANHMSLFFASPTPFMNIITQTTCKVISQAKIAEVTDSLASLAHICWEMVENPQMSCRFKNQETKKICLRLIVGVIVIYDHVHPNGAFRKDSPFDLKNYVRVIKESGGDDASNLINAIRYTCKHFNDESTPRATKSLLD